MSDALLAFLDAVDKGDDTRAEEAAGALVGMGDEALPTLDRMLRDPDPDRRWWAIRGLAALGTAGAVARIIEALRDPDADVRACAVVALSKLQPQEAIDPLVERLSDTSAYVGRLSADALSRFGEPAVGSLIDAMENGDTATRAGAARALSAIEPPDAIPALYEALDDPSATVTHYAEEALEKIGVGTILFRP